MTIQTINGYSTPAPAAPPTKRESAAAADVATKAPETPVKQASAQPTPQQVEKALDQVKAAMSAKASALTFSLDDSTGQTIARVVDSETGEVIRQIPSKELLDIARALDKMQGTLLKQSA